MLPFRGQISSRPTCDEKNCGRDGICGKGRIRPGGRVWGDVFTLVAVNKSCKCHKQLDCIGGMKLGNRCVGEKWTDGRAVSYA